MEIGIGRSSNLVEIRVAARTTPRARDPAVWVKQLRLIRKYFKEIAAGITLPSANSLWHHYNWRLRGRAGPKRQAGDKTLLMDFCRRSAVAASLSLACVTAVPSAAAEVDFQTAMPEEVGVDSRALVRLSAWIRDQRLDVRALLVVKDGRLVFERYSQGVTREHNHAIYSVTKSVTSLLIGMLIDEGKIAGPRAKIAEVLPALPRADRLASLLEDKREIEVGHVLTMSTGLRYQHDPERNPIYAARDRLTAALSVPVAARPGTLVQYSDGDAAIAGALVMAASRKSLEMFARERLFQPLAMQNIEWPAIDAAGLHPGGWALRMRAIDMAKLGQLVLDDGVWNGRRLVSHAWIEASTTKKISPTYGYFWWVDNYAERGVSAEGFKGQRIIVMSRRKLVVVIAAVLPTRQEIPLVAQMIHEFIGPATMQGEALAPSADLHRALAMELALAHQTKGDPRNNIEWQDTPRR